MVNNSHILPEIEWKTSSKLISYPFATDFMEQRVAEIACGNAPECIWLLQHPSLYTAGTSAKVADLLTPNRFPVHHTGRGGEYTYHGPGQRVVYVMLDLNKRRRDVRWFVSEMERWVMETLACFGVEAERREGRVGLWVERKKGEKIVEDKIAAIGIRMRRWVSFHGMSLNVAPELEHFSGIVPCGISEHGVTSLSDLGVNATFDEVDAALKQNFALRFHPLRDVI